MRNTSPVSPLEERNFAPLLPAAARVVTPARDEASTARFLPRSLQCSRLQYSSSPVVHTAPSLLASERAVRESNRGVIESSRLASNQQADPLPQSLKGVWFPLRANP